jgi:PAS domain S-box-containing protein
MKNNPAKEPAPTAQTSFFSGSFTGPFARYAFAVVVVVAAFLARYLLADLFGPRVAYITFSPAVMVAALLGGFWPGIVATGLSGLLAAVWIFPPVGQFKIENTADLVSLAVFLGMGVVMSAVASLYRGTRERAAAYDKTQAVREAEECFREVAGALPAASGFARPPARPPEPMRVFKTRLAFDVCLALTLALLMTVGLLSYRNMTSAVEADRWETHTYVVIYELGDLLSALGDVTSSQRGYLITGDQSYLDQYAKALGRVDQHLNLLRLQTADNPRQQQRFALIDRLKTERLALIKDILELRVTKGFEAASAALMTSRGQQLMDDLRRQVDEARQEEAQLLKERGQEKESSTDRTIHSVVLGASLGGIVLVAVFILLKLEFARRQRVEQELQVHQDHLTELVDLRTEELRREREALQESEERLRITLTSIGDAVIATDAAGRVTFLNPVAAVLTGWRQEEARGQPVQSVFRIIDAQTREPGGDIVAQVLREKRVVALANHTSLLARDGRECPIEDSAAPILDAAGNLTGAVLVFHDVTERKQIENTFQFLAQYGSSGADGTFFHALARYLAQALGLDFVCIDRLETDQLSARTLAMFDQGQFQDNVSYTLKDTPCGEVVGRRICCFPRNVRGLFPRDAVLQALQAESYLGTTLWSAQGEPIGLIAVIGRKPLADTLLAEAILQIVAVRAAGELERQQAEEQLRELTRRLTYHVDNSPLAVIEWGPDMRLIRWSGEAEKIFGWKAEEVLGKRMEDFRWIYPEDAARVGEVSTDLQTGATPRRFSANRNYRKDGSIVHCEWYNSSLVDAAGQLRSILSLVLDVTARQQAEAELQKRAEELRVINEEQEHLNRAMVGREIRMIELKKEVNEACAQAGQPPRYREDFDHG